MKKLLILATLFICILCSCNVQKDLDHLMVNVSEFQMNSDILKDGDYVDVLGCSGNLTKEHEIDFYNLVVVKSVKTGDTVNILVTNFYQANLRNRRTRFMSNSSLIGIFSESVNEIDQFRGKKVDDLKGKSFKKVLYDNEYIEVDVRRYPTITGNLGEFTLDGSLDDLDL